MKPSDLKTMMIEKWEFSVCLIFLHGLFFLVPGNVSAQSQEYMETLYFASGSCTLGPSETNKLNRIVRDINYLTGSIEISGFTDSVGTMQSNWHLSAKRSESVIAWFANQDRQISYQVKNFGELHPVSRKDLWLNRRVEIRYRKHSPDPKMPDSAAMIIVRKLDLENIYFKPDEAILEPASMPYLDRLAEILKKDTMDEFEIRGHVNWHPLVTSISDSGYKAKMFKLSADRAKTIYDILIDKGIPAYQMNWKGMGNTEMLFPNASNDEEKRRNMRVEILIVR